MQHTDSTAPVQTAEKAGIWSFGQASDMQRFAPKSILTSIIDDWAPYYVERAIAARDGTWSQQDTWHGLKEGMVAMSPYNKGMGADLVKEAEQLQKDLASGKIHSFTGPIYDQKGNILVAISENNEIYIDRRKVELRAIRPNIIRLKAENPEGAVIIQADKASQTGLLVEAMDQIRLAGVLEISIAAEND